MSGLTAKDWLTTLSSILIALLTAYFTVRLAIRRFHSEKRWQQKFDAYRKLFVALHQLKEHAWHELSLLENARTLPTGSEAETNRTEMIQQLEDEMILGISELRLQFDIGTFVIDEAAVKLLENLMLSLDEGVELGRSQGAEKYYSHREATVGDCQGALRKIARNDLSRVWN